MNEQHHISDRIEPVLKHINIITTQMYRIAKDVTFGLSEGCNTKERALSILTDQIHDDSVTLQAMIDKLYPKT